MDDTGRSGARKLRLSRETLRDLEPSAEQAALVRGGQQQNDPSDAWGGEWSFCYCPVAPIMALARTHYSDGCRGRVRVEVDLDAAELKRLAESLPGWAASGRGAALDMDVEELQEIGRRMPKLGTKPRRRIAPSKLPKWSRREGPGDIR